MIVDNLSLRIAPGESLAIIGRNGVGKSTLLELMIGRARWHSGTIRFGGQDIVPLRTYQRNRLGLGYVPQNREVFPSLTVAEHFQIAQTPGRWNRDLVLDLFPSLSHRMNAQGGTLSGGEQQMLAIARALLGNPKLLLMDEPSEGLAPVVVEQLIAAIKVLARDDLLAILIVEQRVDLALEIASRCIVMDRGRISLETNADQLREGAADLGSIMGITHAI